MKSRLEEDLRIGDLEGLIMDRFQVDSFQPKFCDEKDVTVVAFMVSQKDSAVKLSDYIARGPFNFLNVEASSSPDESGSYVVLAELDRSQEMFNTIDQLLRYIDRQVHIRDWYFKPFSSDKHIPWNKENFVASVPQNPQEFQSGKNGDSKDGHPAAESAPEKVDAAKVGEKAPEKAMDVVNYSLLARIVEREISKSSRSYFVEFQKQFRKVSKDNRRLLQHFREIKTDHQALIKQFELHQQRERLALLREQQDIKRIRDLEDRLTYILYTGPEKREISVSDASTPTIAMEPADPPAAGHDAEEIVDTEIDSVQWAPGSRQTVADTSISTDTAVEEAEILPTDSEPSDPPDRADVADHTGRGESDVAGKAEESDGNEAQTDLKTDKPEAAADDSPVGDIFRQAMEASEQKNYTEAIEGFTRITEMSPDEPRAFYNLAVLYFRLADYERAEHYASAAINLGVDGARKILEKAATKKSAPSGRKINAAAKQSPVAEGERKADRRRRRQMDTGIRSDEDPLSGFEGKTVEIDAPPFATPTAPQRQTIPAADSNRDLQTADTEALQEGELPSYDDTGASDTIVIDSRTLAGDEQDNEAGADVAPSGHKQSKIEEDLPADSSIPTVAPEPLDLEEMPTALLDDFIQTVADAQAPLAEESAVEEQPGRDEPAVSEESSEAATPAAPEAAVVAEALAAPGDKPSAAKADAAVEVDAMADQIDTAVEAQPDAADEATPGAAVEVQPDAAVDVQRQAAAEAQADTGKEAESLPSPADRPEEDPVDKEKSPPVVEADLFARGLAASTRKNYAEALQHFTRFVELNPRQPRGYYNLSILHYRLKDFETARDMARKALDMGIGAAQKVFEKSQIRLAKERNALLDSVESASTDTIFEELDTGAFETIDPGSLEEIPVTDAEVPPPPVSEELPAGSPEAPADVPPAPAGEPAQIEAAAPAPADPSSGEDPVAEPIPEFPVLTGEFAQEAGLSADDAVVGPAEAELPEIEAAAIPDPAAGAEGPPAAADAGQPAVPPAALDERPVAAAAESPAQAAPEPKPAATESGEQKNEPPAPAPPEVTQPAQPEADPDKAAEDLFAQAMAAYANKDFDQAIEIFNRFISLRPREPRGYYNLAIVHYRKKDYSAAGVNAEKASKLGARAARKILQKIKKKRLASEASSAGPAAASKKRRRQRPTAGKEPSATVGKPRKPSQAAKKPDTEGAAAAPISTPEPVESPAVAGNIGDISDYDTATFDIAEVLGHDPVVWDADDMEEELDTSEIQPPLVGEESSDDVFVFESAAATGSAETPAAQPSAPADEPSAAAKQPNRSADRAEKKAKPKGGGGSGIPGSDEFSLGLAASERKEYLKAIRYFKKFTEISPKDPRGYYNLAVVSYRLKSYETAREHAKRALELGSKPAAKILTKLKSMQAAA